MSDEKETLTVDEERLKQILRDVIGVEEGETLYQRLDRIEENQVNTNAWIFFAMTNLIRVPKIWLKWRQDVARIISEMKRKKLSTITEYSETL